MSTTPFTEVPSLTFDGCYRVPADVFTLSRFREWVHGGDFPEKGRASFIRGSVEVEMSPENLETHNAVKTEITGGLRELLKQRRIGRLYSDRAMFVCPEADISTEPDAMFCSHESRRSGRVRQVEWTKGSGDFVEVVGVPDLVVEVVSTSSVRKDTKLLRRQYYQAGIPEYWLVDGFRSELVLHGRTPFELIRILGQTFVAFFIFFFAFSTFIVIFGLNDRKLNVGRTPKHS